MDHRPPARRGRPRLLDRIAIHSADQRRRAGIEDQPEPFRFDRRDILRELKRDDRQWVGGAAVSWFWLVGAVTLSLAPVIVKSRIGAGVEVETAINLFFAIGIAIGSLLAALLAHGRIWLAPAPFLLLIMAGFIIDLGLTAGIAAGVRYVIIALSQGITLGAA